MPGGFTLYTSPASNVVLLKSLAIYAQGPDPSQVFVNLNRPNPATNVQIYFSTLTPGQNTYLDVWIALEPGDQVTTYCSTANVHFWGSGAVLPLPSA